MLKPFLDSSTSYFFKNVNHRSDIRFSKENLYNSGCHAQGKQAVLNNNIFYRESIPIGIDL
jgi:hypothetical protein